MKYIKVLKSYLKRILLRIGTWACMILLAMGVMGTGAYAKESQEADSGFSFDLEESVRFQEEAQESSEASSESFSQSTELSELSFLKREQAYLLLSQKPGKKELEEALPRTLLARFADGACEEIPVTWRASEDYEHSSFFLYTFCPVLPQGLKAKEGLKLPYVTLMLGQGSDPTSSVGKLSGKTNEEKIYNFLLSSMKLNTAVACGILANIYAESGFNPTTQGDGGTSYGICQWHLERKERLTSYCQENGYKVSDLEGQLKYLQMELKTYYPKVLGILEGVENTSEGAYQAGYAWCRYFEVPANVESASQSRGRVARDTYWPKYGNSSSYPTPTPSYDDEDDDDDDDEEQQVVSVSFETTKVTATDTDATLGVSVHVQGGSCSSIGLVIYEEDGLELGAGTDKSGKTSVQFQVKKDLGITLMPDSGYEYRFYAVVNKKEYYSKISKFSTRKSEGTPEKVTPTPIVDDDPVTPTPTPVRRPTATPTPSPADHQSSFLLQHSATLYVNSGIDELELLDGVANGTKVTFTTSNKKVATVNKKGKVTAVGKGEAVITAVKTVNSKTYKDSCSITVKKPSLTVPSKVSLKKGGTYVLRVSYFPSGKVTYKSSNTKIAKVSAKGVVTGKKKGNCKISVTCNKVTKKVKVVVK